MLYRDSVPFDISYAELYKLVDGIKDPLLEANKKIKKIYLDPLAQAAVDGDANTILSLLHQLKTEYPGVESFASAQPRQLSVLYQDYMTALADIDLGHYPQVVSVLMDTTFVSKEVQNHVNDALISYLFGSHKEFTDTNEFCHRMILLLLNDRINNEATQNIVRSSVQILSKSNNDALKLSQTQPNQFIWYHQLIQAAKVVLSTESIENPSSIHRDTLLRTLCKEENYNSLAAQYFLMIPEIRNQLNLKNEDKPVFIDPVLSSSQAMRLNQPQHTLPRELNTAEFKKKNDEEQAKLLIQNYILDKKTSSGNQSLPITEIMKQDKADILNQLSMIHFNKNLSQKIDLLLYKEMRRLSYSKSRSGNFLVSIGLEKNSNDKFSALTSLKLIFDIQKNGFKSIDELNERLHAWNSQYKNVIQERRNTIHTFFAPHHTCSTKKMVENIFSLLNTMDTKTTGTSIQSFC